MKKLIASIFLALGMASAATAGDFSTSGVTYTTPDFTATGGTRAVAGFDSTFTRFPLVSGATYTISWASTNGTSYGMAIHDFVAAESATGDPFAYPSGLPTSVLAADQNFSTTGAVSFTSLIDGFGTIELTDFVSSPVAATLTMASDITPVPLPAAGLMLLSGIAFFGVVRRRRTTAQPA